MDTHTEPASAPTDAVPPHEPQGEGSGVTSSDRALTQHGLSRVVNESGDFWDHSRTEVEPWENAHAAVLAKEFVHLLGEVYEFFCPHHESTAFAPPEGGRLNWDVPCDCVDPEMRDTRVTKIMDGERVWTKTIAEIEGPLPEGFKRWSPGDGR